MLIKTTLLDAIKWGQKKLEEAKINNARFEAEVLMAHVMGQSRGEIYLNFSLPICEEKFNIFKGSIAKRATHYPTQYIIGKQEFMSLDFLVTPDVLIPRPDTEVLVEKVITLAKNLRCPKILDLCTGSGAIAISVAKNINGSMVTATDISTKALTVARENAVINKVEVNFQEGNLLTPVSGEKFDIIASNPPYIPSADIQTLMPEVKNYEPLGALDGGKDGLNLYRRIISQAPCYLNPGGLLILEIGYDQAVVVQELFIEQCVYGQTEIIQDYGGRDRVVFARLS